MACAGRIEQSAYVKVEDGIQLNLTMEEAEFIKSVLRHVGGSPTLSLRKHSDNILRTLHSAGVKHYENDYTSPNRSKDWQLVGSIQCTEYKMARATLNDED